MADSIAEMLRAQGVDKRLAGGRVGNPMELAFVAQQNKLTEHEVADLLHRSGVGKEIFDALPPETKEIIVDGLFRLWKIDRFGRVVEEEDRKKLGGVEGVKRTVEEELEEIRRNYHGNNEWLPVSVDLLIKASREEDPEKHSSYKNGTCQTADNYIRKLGGLNDSYVNSCVNSTSYSRLSVEEKDRASRYIFQERGSRVEELKGVFQQFGQVVAAIPLPKTS